MSLRGSLDLEPLDRDAWARLAAGFLDHNYRQAWAFAEASAARHGATSERVAIRRNGGLQGICAVRCKPVPFGLGGIAYASGGPLVRTGDSGDLARLANTLAALRREYVQRRALVLRILPPTADPEWNAATDEVYRSAGFGVGDSESYRTLLVDLRRPIAEVRASLAGKWRNQLNAAEKQGLEVVSGDDLQLLDRFAAIFEGFRARKGFNVDLDAGFYGQVQRHNLADERYTTMLALRDGEIHAGYVGSFLGANAIYLLGLSCPPGLRSKAAYLLQWHAILEAQRREMHWYDLGGIDPGANPGVYHFKQGLSGLEVRVPGYEAMPKGVRSAITRFAETGYRSVRRLTARRRKS